MIFVIGGKYNNKLDFVLAKYNLTIADVYDGESKDKYQDEKVIYNFQAIVKKFSMLGITTEEILKNIAEILKRDDLIIITDENGYGIVPLDKDERIFRETCGRICCHLAERADEVYRVMYGIGNKIKG